MNLSVNEYREILDTLPGYREINGIPRDSGEMTVLHNCSLHFTLGKKDTVSKHTVLVTRYFDTTS